MINSRYDPDTDEASPFEPHVGSHGGLGGPQQRGFLIYPRELPEPGGDRRRRALHRVLRGWLTDLGHPEPARDDSAADSLTGWSSAAEEGAGPRCSGPVG